jgi:hypothetical protein
MATVTQRSLIPCIVAGLLATLAACDSVQNAVVTIVPPDDAGDATVPIKPGAGVGSSCSADPDCRTGLRCGAAGSCEPGHSLGEGELCAISDECKQGLYCNSLRVCAKAGDKTDGDPCASDGDCGTGRRCTVTGLSVVCQQEGSGDLGATCKSAAECFAGLGCLAGKCASLPPGSPPIGVPTWTGEECTDDPSAPVLSYFRIPRGTDDGDFYRLPFPNDARTVGSHPDLRGHPSPGAELLGFDPVDRYLRAIEEETEGFGIYPTVLFRFSGDVDWDSMKKAPGVQWVDITPDASTFGDSLGYYWNASGGRIRYVCPNWLAIRPPGGYPLTAGHTYAVYFTVGATVVGSSTLVQRAADFAAMLAQVTPSDSALVPAHAKYKVFRDYLTAKNIASDTILNAAVFTAGPVRKPAEKLAEATAAAPIPTAANWVRCGAGVKSPCPQADSDRGCAEAQAEFDELHALVTLPVYQQGTAPYLAPTDGGGFQFDSEGKPQRVRTEQVCMALSVPKGSGMPTNGWPLVVFAHGTGGGFTSHISNGISKALSSVDMAAAGTVRFAVLGIDQVQHGPRRGTSTMSPNDLFFNFANPKAAKYNPLQGAADQLALARFAAALQLAAPSSPTAQEIKIDAAKLVYWGHSQGATQGAIAVPYSNVYKAAVLSGNGASLMTSLLTKTSPVNIPAALPWVLLDPDSSMQLAGGIFHPVLSLLQQWIDPADPLSYAGAMAAQPPTGIPAHHVFQPYGLNDTYSPKDTQATYLVAARMGLVAADSSAQTPDNLFDLPVGTTNAGNLTVDSKPVTALARQYAPSGYDGHFVSTRNANAMRDVAAFLAAAVISDQPPKVGP